MINPWRYRFAVALLILVVMWSHATVTDALPNTPLGMLMFHGSAALCDLILIYSFPSLVKGQLCKDMEALCIASILGNTLGWFAYLAYAPPDFYNCLMWSITYIQWGRLLMADNDDPDFVGRFMVRGNHTGRV